MSEDTFHTEYNIASKLIKSISNDLKVREDKIRQNAPVVKDNQLIAQQLNKLKNQIDSLNSVIVAYQNGEANIPAGEIDRRRKKINELSNTHFEYNEKFRSAMGFINPNHTFKPSNEKKYTDNLERNTVTVTQLQKDRTDLEGQFDKRLEEMGDAVKTLKNGQDQMSGELTYQNEVLIPKIEQGIDNNTLKFIKNNKKLVKILKKGSDCKLWVVIVLELALLIFLILP